MPVDLDLRRPLSPRTWISLILWSALVGCSPPEPVKIGFMAGISGRVADLGISGRDAAQCAVELRNAAGGISGRKVRLIIKDDHQQPDRARQAVRELAQEGVAAIVGPMTSDMAMAAVPIANELGVLLVSPTVTTESLSHLDDQFFRVTSTTRSFASRNALYQLKTGRMRRVAAVYDMGNRSFTENWLHHFRQAFMEGGGEIITTMSFEVSQETTFLKIARDLLASGPDGILIVANSMDSALLCRQIRKLNASIPITLSDWGATERLLELGGQDVEGITVVQTFDRHSRAPRYLEFRQTYMARSNREPGFPGVHTYDAFQVVMEAIQQQKPGQSLKETLLAIRQFQGLQAVLSFDEFGDVTPPQASMSVVREGQFVVVE